MAGIYLHIPFCKTRCIYCDFYKETDESQIDNFVNAICLEAQLRKNELKKPIKTIYFGGGTPSRLSHRHFVQIFDTLFANFFIAKDAEITLECNPDDLTDRYIAILRQLPVNRLSVGIQSFNNDELRFLSRRHNAQQAEEAVVKAQEAGFNNISIDLMYGLPKQTKEIWKSNIQKALRLNVDHVSAYHLIYERDTKLYTLLQKGRVTQVADDLSNDMFELLINMLTENDYEHYEISNFARHKKYSVHNTSYWQNEPYLGLGPSAHSFNGKERSWNVASLEKYIHAINSGDTRRQTEILKPKERYNEFVLTGLRTMWGINLQELKSTLGEDFYNYCMETAQKYIDRNLLTVEDGHLRINREGIFISDGIMSDLMWVE